MYNFELARVAREIKKHKAKSVLIQLPEGLKKYAKDIVNELERAGVEVVISGEPCYGACDIKREGCDLTVHFGHAPFCKPDPNVVYVESDMLENCTLVAKSALAALNSGTRIGLVTTIQHVKCLPEVKRMLEDSKHKALIGKHGPRAIYDGQVLGCDYGAATSIAEKVDEFLFIGSGEFHPIGVAYYTGKRVIKADPYSMSGGEADTRDWFKEKYLRIMKADNAHDFGVIIGTKSGQRDIELARKARRALQRKGKNAFLVTLNEITPQAVDYLPFDAFIMTACQRLVIDDWKNFKKPILLPEEVKEL